MMRAFLVVLLVGCVGNDTGSGADTGGDTGQVQDGVACVLTCGDEVWCEVVDVPEDCSRRIRDLRGNVGVPAECDDPYQVGAAYSDPTVTCEQALIEQT